MKRVNVITKTTTAHEPATPLPWIAHDSNDGVPGLILPGAPVVAGGLVVARVWESLDPIIHVERATQNAAYIAHAANAYPRLVAALREAVAAAAMRSDSVKSVDRHYAALDAANDVLRDLGELP